MNVYKLFSGASSFHELQRFADLDAATTWASKNLQGGWIVRNADGAIVARAKSGEVLL